MNDIKFFDENIGISEPVVLNRGPCNISGGPHAKYKKLEVLNDILGVHEENQLRTLFIFKNSISIVIYIILKNIY